MTSWALDHLTYQQLKSESSALFPVHKTDESKCELHGLCPFHPEKNPSFSYNWVKDKYHCLSCGASGDLISLWGHSKGIPKEDQFKRFKAEFGGDTPSATRGGSRGQLPGKSHEGGQANKPKGDKILDQKHYDALPFLPSEWVSRLVETRGWTPEAISRHGLRLHVRKDGERRIAIPIFENGQLRNIRLYLPGAAENKMISWAKGFGDSRLFPDPAAWAKDETLFLCEGEPDCLCALSLGLDACTQTAGAGTWPARLSAFFRGRDVVICYDADEKGRDGAAKVASKLAGVASRIRIIRWPDFMGFTPDHGQDLIDFIVKHGKGRNDLLELAAQAEEYAASQCGSAQPSEQFHSMAGGRTSLRTNLVARHIIESWELITDDQTGLVYRWLDDFGFWKETPLSQIRRYALGLMADEGTKARAEDVAQQVADLTGREMLDSWNAQKGVLCLKNGRYNLKTNQLGPHRKEDYFTYRFPVNFNPEAKWDRWRQFLTETIQDEGPISELREWFGYALTKWTHFEMALLLIGPGSDGKSTTLNVLQALVGNENCANVDFAALEDQFHRASLLGKILNVATEVEATVFSSAYFKALVSGDRLNASHKFKPVFEFRPFCKLAFSSNRFPKVQDNSHAFYRRVLPIKFKKSFKTEERDPHLFETLLSELDGIFFWALSGLESLRHYKGFRRSQETESVLQEYKETNSPLITFLDAETSAEPDGWLEPSVTKADLYKAYREFCGRYGFGALNEVHFARELREQRPGVTDAKPREDGGSRIRIWKGIRHVGAN